MAQDENVPPPEIAISTSSDHADSRKYCTFGCCPEWLRDVICCFSITVGICTTMTIIFAFTIFESPEGN